METGTHRNKQMWRHKGMERQRKCEDMGKVQTQENGEVETQTQETCRPTCRQGKTWTWKHKDMGDPDAETREHGNTKWKYADVETGRCRN